MKRTAVVLMVWLMAIPAHALTLEGGVEKNNIEGKIGIRISLTGHIQKVHPGSPAEIAGLKKHDTVTAVDGKKHAIDEISGEPGSIVHLDVRRGFHKFAIDVERIDVRDIAYNSKPVSLDHL